jgi:hypothetical protein
MNTMNVLLAMPLQRLAVPDANLLDTGKIARVWNLKEQFS